MIFDMPPPMDLAPGVLEGDENDEIVDTLQRYLPDPDVPSYSNVCARPAPSGDRVSKIYIDKSRIAINDALRRGGTDLIMQCTPTVPRSHVASLGGGYHTINTPAPHTAPPAVHAAAVAKGAKPAPAPAPASNSGPATQGGAVGYHYHHHPYHLFGKH